MRHDAKVPRAAADYFGLDTEWPHRDNHPTVVEAFYPGKGWRRTPYNRKYVSGNYLRTLRAEGATFVALRQRYRTADFDIREVT